MSLNIVQWLTSDRHRQKGSEATILAFWQNPIDLERLHQEALRLPGSFEWPRSQTGTETEDEKTCRDCWRDSQGYALRGHSDAWLVGELGYGVRGSYLRPGARDSWRNRRRLPRWQASWETAQKGIHSQVKTVLYVLYLYYNFTRF